MAQTEHIPDAAGALLALPPSRFTAERDALARRLAAAGDPTAAAVRKVRRPLGLAWLLNRVARERPEEAGALLDAADAVRAAHAAALAGRGGGTLRDADEALHAATRRLRSAAAEALREAGRPAAGDVLARVELLLRAGALGGPAEREALRAGALAREPEVGGEPAFSCPLTGPPPRRRGGGGLGPAPAPATKAPPSRPRGRRGVGGGAPGDEGGQAGDETRDSARAEGAVAGRGEGAADEERARERERARLRVEERAREREHRRAVAQARRDLAAAEKVAARAERDAARAGARAAEARRAAERQHAAAERALAAARAAGDAVARARDALRAAAEALR
jgi:hypothetical protein